MDSKANISSTFTEKSDSIVEDIKKKYGLEETLEKLKIEGRNYNTFILTKLTMLHSRKEISDQELSNSLQKELSISEETSKLIAKDIITNLIPTLGKPGEKEEKKPKEKSETFTKIKPPMEVEKILQKQPQPMQAPRKKIPPLKEDVVEKPVSADQPRRQDSYREPIE